MDSREKTREELLKQLDVLRKEYDSVKELYDKEITELRKTISEVTKSEEKFRKAYMTSPDSININRLSDGMYVSINEGFTRITGYTEEETIGKTSLEMNIWFDPVERTNLVNELNAKGDVKNMEAKFLAKNGAVINGLIAASLIDLDKVPHILSVIRDITIRKNAEEALAQEKYLMEAIMNNLPDHVYFKDLQSRFIRINRDHALSFGLTDPSQAVGKTDFDFFTEEHSKQAYDDEQRIILTGQPIRKEEKLTRENRPDTWSSTIKLPLHDKDGKIIGTFGISSDITEKRKSEEQLFLLANALKSTHECISITDINDKVLFLNPAFVKTYGFTENDLKEESISIIRSPNNPPEIVNEILPATMRGGWNGEILNRKKDGTEFPVFLSTAVVRDNQGNPIALIGVANDITIRKRMELESQVIYEITQGVTTTSNLDELLRLIHNSLGKVVYAENCFIALYDNKSGLFNFPYFIDKFDPMPLPTSMRKSCSSYVFRTVKPLLLTQKRFDELKEQNEVELVGSNSPSWIGIPLQTPSRTIGVLVLQHYEKENVYSESDVRFLMSIGGQIALSIERKKAEEEIKLKNELLQIINAEKDKFFSIVAHDLRGPLSAFVMATQILTEQIQTMDIEEIREIAMSMKTSATNIYSLLENLLEWSRLRRGGMDFIPEIINLKKSVSACIDILSESAVKKRIGIENAIPDNLVIFADNHMFDTVVRNLISNAIKFTSPGGKVRVSAELKDENLIEVKISDTGIGMSPTLKNKLFHLSEKTSRQGTEGEPSSGLGLLLSKEFIEKHGGKIWAESEEGVGSTFYFTISRLKV
jgi:PAS domain S-box-containing protein